jgi:hypothetical protein
MNEANRLEDITGQPETVEQEIQRKALTAPRVTPADIEANIVSEYYFRADHGVYGAARDPVQPGPLTPNFKVGMSRSRC